LPRHQDARCEAVGLSLHAIVLNKHSLLGVVEPQCQMPVQHDVPQFMSAREAKTTVLILDLLADGDSGWSFAPGAADDIRAKAGEVAHLEVHA